MIPFQSGLTAACQSSKTSLPQAEQIMVSFVESHVPKGACPLAGNSIYSDKRFLEKYMPGFVAHLHYRMVDVSTVKELCRWAHMYFAAMVAEGHICFVCM